MNTAANMASAFNIGTTVRLPRSGKLLLLFAALLHFLLTRLNQVLRCLSWASEYTAMMTASLPASLLSEVDIGMFRTCYSTYFMDAETLYCPQAHRFRAHVP